jgi:hypothetical protein
MYINVAVGTKENVSTVGILIKISVLEGKESLWISSRAGPEPLCCLNNMSDTHILIEVPLYDLMWSFEVTVYEVQCVQFILLPACYFKYIHTWNVLKFLNRKSSMKLTKKQFFVHMQQFLHLKMNLSELPNLNMAVCNTVYYQIHRF